MVWRTDNEPLHRNSILILHGCMMHPSVVLLTDQKAVPELFLRHTTRDVQSPPKTHATQEWRHSEQAGLSDGGFAQQLQGQGPVWTARCEARGVPHLRHVAFGGNGLAGRWKPHGGDACLRYLLCFVREPSQPVRPLVAVAQAAALPVEALEQHLLAAARWIQLRLIALIAPPPAATPGVMASDPFPCATPPVSSVSHFDAANALRRSATFKNQLGEARQASGRII